jgi:predicted RNase H-like nuclease (RuvC/YqgF family)
VAKLKALLTKEEFEALTDPIKEFYIEKDGKHVLDSDHEDITGLKNTVAALRQERKTAEDELAKWKALGDPAKASEALKKVQELEEQEARKAGEWDQLKAQMTKRHADEKADLEKKLAEKDTDIQTLVVDREIIATLTRPDIKGSVTVLLPHVRQRVKAVKEGSEWKAVVHDGKGTPQVADGAGTPMTIKQLCEEMRKQADFAPNFASQSTGGGGTPTNGASGGSGGGRKQVSRKDVAALSANMDAIAKGEVEITD